MRFWSKTSQSAPVLAVAVLVLAACGSDSDGSEAAAATPGAGSPTVVVTTNILGDVVGQLIGDQAEVVTIMPVGADPHDFQPSAQEVDQLLEADALIVNGGDFEEGLIDVIGSAGEAGVPTFEATSAVDTIAYGEAGHSEAGDEDEEGHEEHGDGGEEDHDEEGHDEDEHEHDGDDPHFFSDPTRMADAVEAIGEFLKAEVDGLDAADVDAATTDYVDQLQALDVEVEALLDEIPEAQKILVTNHEVFGYFADRYGFEVVGTVIPGGTTVDGVSARELAELAEDIERAGVPAIFGDTSSSDSLIETLADEVGEIEIVDLYTESLGESGSDGDTYLDMVRTNATRISEALS